MKKKRPLTKKILKDIETLRSQKILTLENAHALGQLCDPKSYRLAAMLRQHKDIEKFAHNHNLDARKFFPYKESGKISIMVAIKRRVCRTLRHPNDILNLPEIKNELSALYRKIGNVRIVDAAVFLSQYPRHIEPNLENPEIAAMEGVIFGYKPCDIEYFLNSRYFGKQKHEHEYVAAYEHRGRILCPSCAHETLEKRGDTLTN